MPQATLASPRPAGGLGAIAEVASGASLPDQGAAPAGAHHHGSHTKSISLALAEPSDAQPVAAPKPLNYRQTSPGQYPLPEDTESPDVPAPKPQHGNSANSAGGLHLDLTPPRWQNQPGQQSAEARSRSRSVSDREIAAAIGEPSVSMGARLLTESASQLLRQASGACAHRGSASTPAAAALTASSGGGAAPNFARTSSTVPGRSTMSRQASAQERWRIAAARATTSSAAADPVLAQAAAMAANQRAIGQQTASSAGGGNFRVSDISALDSAGGRGSFNGRNRMSMRFDGHGGRPAQVPTPSGAQTMSWCATGLMTPLPAACACQCSRSA